MYETIFSPVNYGGLELKNRIIFAPTTFGLSDEEYFAKIRAIAAGGCAMIIVGDVPVGKSRFEKSLFDKKGFAWYQSLAEIVHSCGCKLCAQLHQSDSNMAAMLKYVPGVLTKKITMQQLRTLLNEEVAPYITNLPQRKIDKIIHGFGEAAELAVKAGFDMVQIHGDRMCGSFSSSVFNHRTDAYGGSAENRARFAVEAVRAVRSRLPELPIDYKLAVRQEDPHYGNAGVLESELGIFVPLLVEAGVTSFHVTLANHSSLEDTIPPAHKAAARAAVWDAFFRQALELLPTTLPQGLREVSSSLLTSLTAVDLATLERTLEFLAPSAEPVDITADALPGDWAGGHYTVSDASRAAVQSFFNLSPAAAQSASGSEP